MQTYRPDRLVRVLSGAVSVAYYVAWVATVLALAGIPIVRALGERHGDAYFQLEAPVRLNPTTPLVTARNPAVHFKITEARAQLRVPVSYVSTAVVALGWLATAVGAALALLFLSRLRRLFDRVKKGAPFDVANATDLRQLGVLLLLLTGVRITYEFWLSLALSNLIEGPGNQLGTGLDLHLGAVFVALVLIVLGEVFRRGAALEDEQSLVV